MSGHQIEPNGAGLDIALALNGQDFQQPATWIPVVASKASFAAAATTGAPIATLVDPFGSGSTFAAQGALPGQLALTGGNVTKGSGAAVSGAVYGMFVKATAADGIRSVVSAIYFDAK